MAGPLEDRAVLVQVVLPFKYSFEDGNGPARFKAD